MRLETHIPFSLHGEWKKIMYECQMYYPEFDPLNPLHQMFAMQILLAREIVRIRELNGSATK